jgi:hypothetical protein
VLLVCCSSPKDADRLTDLAEALGGYEISDTGSLVRVEVDKREERLRKLRDSTGTGPAPELSLDWIIRRLVATN